MRIDRVERVTGSTPQVLYDANTARRTKAATPSAITRPFSEIKSEPLKCLARTHPSWEASAFSSEIRALESPSRRLTCRARHSRRNIP